MPGWQVKRSKPVLHIGTSQCQGRSGPVAFSSLAFSSAVRSVNRLQEHAESGTKKNHHDQPSKKLIADIVPDLPSND